MNDHPTHNAAVRDALLASIKSLPSTMRSIVLMRLGDDLSNEEIAAVLKLPPEKVSQKYASAIYTLQLAKDQANDPHKRQGGQRRASMLIEGVEHFLCCKCEAWVPRSGFYPWSNPKSKCGIRSWCARCDNTSRNTRRRWIPSRLARKGQATA